MEQLTEKEKIQIIQQFLDETNSFFLFKDFIEEKGYNLQEFGIEE